MATRAQAIAEAEKGKSRSAAASGEAKKNAFDKKAGRVSATKAGRVDPKSGMESDVYYAFAFTGFPGDTDEVEAVNLMKEYANDFLGDFNVQVVGSNAAKGQIALTFLASEGEALAANVHAQRDKFVYRGHTLSTVAIDTLEIAAFKLPEVPPAVHPLSGDLPGASHAVPLGQQGLPPVSTPARRAASEMELSPELKAKVLATLKAKQSLPVLPGNDGSGTTSDSGKLERMDVKVDSIATRQDLENTMKDTNAHVSTELAYVRVEIRELRVRIKVAENTSGLTPPRSKINWVKDASDLIPRRWVLRLGRSRL